jgi:hypothetical protein
MLWLCVSLVNPRVVEVEREVAYARRLRCGLKLGHGSLWWQYGSEGVG